MKAYVIESEQIGERWFVRAKQETKIIAVGVSDECERVAFFRCLDLLMRHKQEESK